MSALFTKLNLKNQDPVLVLDAPPGFKHELTSLSEVRVVRSTKDVDQVDFVLAFVTTKRQVETAAREIARKAPGDAVVWFAYPKKSSKRCRGEIDRDTGWAALGELGFEAVRQVAVDEDWSALRWRRVKFIKKMTRNPKLARTKEGKARAEASGVVRR